MKNRKAADLVPFLGDVAFQDLAFMIDGTSQVMGLATDIHEQFVDEPPRASKASNPADTLATDIGGKHWAEVPHDWLERHVFLARGVRFPDRVIIDYYLVE